MIDEPERLQQQDRRISYAFLALGVSAALFFCLLATGLLPTAHPAGCSAASIATPHLAPKQRAQLPRSPSARPYIAYGFHALFDWPPQHL